MILQDSLIRVLVDSVDYRAGELARYSHPITHFNPLGQTREHVLGREHSINTIDRAFVGIFDGQFEVVPGHMKFEVGDKVYIATAHTRYSRKPFKVIAIFGSKTYRIEYEGLETTAQLGELIPVHIGNKYNKYRLEGGM